MKTIGLLGGMSWESTQVYYRIINEQTRKRLGDLHSAKLCLYSVDFNEIEKHQRSADWAAAAAILSQAARYVELGGADFLVMCTNTMHKVAAEIERNIGIPLLHIADATAERAMEKGVRSVGLLGTKFTMEDEFYKRRLATYGLDVVVPGDEDREIVNNVIYRELCLGKIAEASRAEFLGIINRLAQEGARAVILGCTEIALLIRQEDTPVQLLDTTHIHAEKAVEKALSD